MGKNDETGLEKYLDAADCVALVKSIVKSFAVANKKPGLEIRASVPAHIPQLMLDPQRIRQIAFNLIGNAVKFTDKGYVEARATFTHNADGMTGALRIDVEDTGCGISEEDIKLLATPFVQVGSKTRQSGGTGLGLAICRQLVFAMGGKPLVKSTLGKGSTFSIFLPEAKIVEGAHQPAAAHDKPARGASDAPDGAKRILVADDQKMNRMVLKAMLAKLGITDVAMAEDGAKALEMLHAEGPDAFDFVLTDMWMPEMNGEDLVRAIRTDPAFCMLKVYLLTADVEARSSYMDAGFTGIILKPPAARRAKGYLRRIMRTRRTASAPFHFQSRKARQACLAA